MRLHLTSLAGVLTLVVSTAAAAQAQPAARQPAGPMQPIPNQTTTSAPTASQPATPRPDEPTMPQSTAPGQTGTTPGQMQTTPGEASQMTPAVTGETPSGQTTAKGKTAATAADVKAGVSVRDQNGAMVGKIESVSSKGAVLNTGTVKVTVPVSGFAKGDNGLVIAMSKADIDAAAKKSPTKPK
jgi:hypothetical protein